jgi:hypothetical protein
LFRASSRLGIELQIILLLLSFSFLLVLSAPIVYMYTSFIKWNFAQTDVWSRQVVHFVELFIKTFSFYMIVPILAASTGYLYFTLDEISSASYLKESISRVGTRTSKTNRR